MSMPKSLNNGHYVPLRSVGNPGMSEVYLCEDTRLNLTVVVKLVRIPRNVSDENQNQQNTLENFKREVGILARNPHDHIVAINYYDTEDYYDTEEQINYALAYMVMPYCEEVSLQDWLNEHRPAPNSLGVKEVAELLTQAGEALNHLHDNGIVHRDIKSTNFLVKNRLSDQSVLPHLLLADFGFAQFVGVGMSQDDRGTYLYKAPEQWANARPVFATDQYQLAIMTYYLLTRKHPFEGSRDEVRNKHIFDDPPVPSIHRSNIPSKVDKVILRALEKKPRKRYPSVKAFTKEFNKASKPGLGRPGWMGWPLFIVMLVALILSLSLNAFLYIQYAPHPIVLQNVIKTCQSGRDTFQIQELPNEQQGDQEYIGISDSSCYIFTTENNTLPSDPAETTIYDNNKTVPTDKPHITIIVATMLSNHDSSSYSGGRSVLQGAAIAQQEYNLHSGGRLPLRLLIANSGTNEHFAPQIAQEIVKLRQTDPSILGVMGWPFSTDEAKEALATLKQARISSVSSSLSSTQFDGLSPYFFRINPSDVSQGIVGATYLLQQGIKYVIVCEDPRNPYSASLAETFKESFMTQANGSDPSVVYYQRGTLSTEGEKLDNFEISVQQDITDDETKLGAQRNQIAVYFAGYANDFANFRAYLNSQYPQVVVMGGDGLSDYFASPSPLGGTDFYFTTFADYRMWDNSPNPPCFIGRYKILFNPNGQMGSVNNLVENDAVLAYDATDALLEAYTNARESASSIPNLESMQSQLTQVSFLGVSGPIALSPSGTPSRKAVYIEYYEVNSTTLKNAPSLSTPQSFPFCR